MGPFTLGDLPPNTKASIVDLRGEPKTRERLVEMGFIPGTVLRTLDRFHGNVVVEVRGTRYALSPGMARNILVKPV